jgi:glycosyltransferase involved in cell wall biosynthesis
VPLISIITPLYQPRLEHLRETIRSVADQVLPPTLDVEWIVQEDGPDRTFSSDFWNAGNVSYMANGAHLGVATTRNIALARAHGDLIQVLDQDDYLLPHALATVAPCFTDPAVHWAVGQADDLLEDGSRKQWPSVLPYGVIPPGLANSIAIERGGNWVVHCAGLMLRTAVLRALGGWIAGWGDDDIVMFAGLAEVTHGHNVNSITWLYRQHSGQLHRRPESQARSQRGRQVALQRVAAMRAAQLRVTEHVLEPHHTPHAGPAEKD